MISVKFDVIAVLSFSFCDGKLKQKKEMSSSQLETKKINEQFAGSLCDGKLKN